MTEYVALLCGINVGKTNRIRMEALREIFESIEVLHVETFLQSGNVLFQSNQSEEDIVSAAESALMSNAGIQTNVILRSAKELARIISGMPFTAEQLAQANTDHPDSGNLYVCFASAPSERSLCFPQSNSAIPKDEYFLAQRNAYLLLHQSIRTSNLANRVQKLLTPATVRNWNVVCRLYEQMHARESSLDTK